MNRAVRLTGREADRERAFAEVEFLAWLLDNSIPVPGTGGRRFGIDAVIGLVPVAGDLVGGLLSLFVIWRASRLGVPRVVVVRMLLNSAIDVVVGTLPIVGDAFDLWFKVNQRNLALMRRYLAEPGTSTRGEWLVVAGIFVVAVAIIAVAVWLVAALLSAVVGLFT